MSFSSRVKEELVENLDKPRHCRLAELSAITVMAGSMKSNVITIDNEKQYAYHKATRIIKHLGIELNSDDGLSALKIKCVNGNLICDRKIIEQTCCKQAFLRGAFLTDGSVTDPEKGYHLEVAFVNENMAIFISDIMKSFQLEPKTIIRKKHHIVYIKDGSMIVDMLNIMGAHKALMSMENVRIVKDVRNNLNRQVNCETANLNKIVSTEVRQNDDILFIEEKKGLNYLNDNLRKVAEIRLSYENISLKEIGEMLQPPLSKSGVNHRLRKISRIADELRRN